MKILLFCYLSLWMLTSTSAQEKVELAIRSATIIDVQTGKLSYNKTILISKGRILSVLNDGIAKQYADAAIQTINAKGKYVIPGLWDMHMHFGGGDTLIGENKNLLSLFIANGITAVRDCAADLSPSVLQWRQEVADGKLLGPTIFTSGPKLEGYKSIWVGDLEIDTKEELQRALDSLQKAKVDFVKITDNTMKPDLYLESLTQVRKRGWPITGHIPAALTLTQVSDAGLSAIEHITYLLRAGNADEAGI